MNNINEDKNVGELIREYTFSLFTDEINKEYDYKKYLESLNKDKLMPIFANMSMITEDEEAIDFCLNKSQKSKTDMIEYISDNQKWIIESIIGNMNSETFESIYNLVHVLDKDGYYKFNYKTITPFNIEVLMILSNIKLAFIRTTNDITEIHIPKDILKVIKKAIKNEEVISKMYQTDQLLKRIQGLISIYGVFKLNDISILDSYFKEYSYYEIDSICWRLKTLDPLYEITSYEDELVLYSSEIDDEEEAIKILNNPLKYKKYDDETLEKIYNQEFIETVAPYREIKKLFKKLKMSNEEINYIKEFLFDDYVIISQLDSNKAKNCFLSNLKGFSNDEELNHLLLNYAVKIANKFPRWELKGDIDKGQTVRVEKIGRNDKCPCGSGKKYKQCCGK